MLAALQSQPGSVPPEAVSQWSAAMLVLVLLGLIVVIGGLLLIALRRASRRARHRQNPRAQHGSNASRVDAWEEAGRRVPTPDRDEDSADRNGGEDTP